MIVAEIQGKAELGDGAPDVVLLSCMPHFTLPLETAEAATHMARVNERFVLCGGAGPSFFEF